MPHFVVAADSSKSFKSCCMTPNAMSDAAPAPKRQKIGIPQASHVRLDPTKDGSALRVSFTIPNKALKQSDLIGALLQRGEGFSIEASTPGVLVWMADKLEGGSEPTSTLENARDQQTLAMLQVRNGPKQQ